MLLLQAMKLKKILCALAASLFVLAASIGASEAAENPALALMKLYWGQIGDRDLLSPYTISILALNELEEGRNTGMVKDFIVWYLETTNDSDMDGLSGTIYDFRISANGDLEPIKDYDSADGYAGVFLHLLNTYYEKTGDKETLVANWQKIEHIAYVISHLQDADGLTRATEKHHMKYLMDNAEAYAGASAFVALSKAVRKGNRKYYEDVCAGIRKGIHEKMFDMKRRNYIWALNNGERFITDLKKFYPGAYSNIMLFAYNRAIFEGYADRKTALWKDIMLEQGGRTADLPIEQRIIFGFAIREMGGKE